MKMECRYRCMVAGDLVKPGKVLEVSEADAAKEPFRSSFVALPSAPAVPAAGAVSGTGAAKTLLVAGLTREEAIQKLRAAKVSVPSNISDARLVERYDETFAAVGQN